MSAKPAQHSRRDRRVKLGPVPHEVARRGRICDTRAVPSSELQAPAGTAAATAADASQTQAAGRGGLAIAGAKVSFILVGFALQLVLSRLLGGAGYGQVALVLAAVGVVNNVVVAAS